MMLDKAEIGLVEHLRWFWRMRRQPAIVQYVAFDGHQPVGSARLNFSDGDLCGWPYRVAPRPVGSGLGRCARFDVIVAPSQRGGGYGRRIIELMVGCAEERGAKMLVADVRRENVASLKAFQRAGFKLRHWTSTEILADLFYAGDIVRLERRCD